MQNTLCISQFPSEGSPCFGPAISINTAMCIYEYTFFFFDHKTMITNEDICMYSDILKWKPEYTEELYYSSL